MLRILLTGSLFILLLNGQQRELILTSDPPAFPEAISAAYTGTAGPHRSEYYWVVANYPRGQSRARGPRQAYGIAATLSGSNYVTIAWSAATGALSYDVLKTTTPVAPGSCTCLVGNTSGTSLNDTGGSLSAYTLSPVGQASATISLNNRDSSVPTILLSAGALQAQVQDKGGAVYNVLAYGADPTGVQYSTSAIQTALNTAATTKGTVELPPGQYLITQLSIPKDLTALIGAGRGADGRGSVLVSASAGVLLDVDTSTGDRYYQQFRDFDIVSTNYNAAVVGLRIAGTGHFYRGTIEGIHFRGTYTALAAAGAGQFAHTLIQGCLFDNNGVNGPMYAIKLTIDGGGLIIADNHFMLMNTGSYGIYYRTTGLGDIVVVANSLGASPSGLAAIGVYLYCEDSCTYGGNVLVTSNRIDDVTQPVSLYNVTNSYVAGNRYSGAATDPISLGGAIEGNTLDWNNLGRSSFRFASPDLDAYEILGQTPGRNVQLTWHYNIDPALAQAKIITYGYLNPLVLQASTVSALASGGQGMVAEGIGIRLTSVAYTGLGTPSNGTVVYCSDCTIANPCAASGTGAIAKRLNGTWICN